MSAGGAGKERVTRVSEELFQAASTAGAAEHRSAKQQLEHWARIGQSVDAQTSSARRRLDAVMSGRLPVTGLTVEEGTAFDALVEADLAERLTAIDFGAALRAEGVTTVSVNDAGELVEHSAPAGAVAEPARVRSRRA